MKWNKGGSSTSLSFSPVPGHCQFTSATGCSLPPFLIPSDQIWEQAQAKDTAPLHPAGRFAVPRAVGCLLTEDWTQISGCASLSLSLLPPRLVFALVLVSLRGRMQVLVQKDTVRALRWLYKNGVWVYNSCEDMSEGAGSNLQKATLVRILLQPNCETKTV